MGDSLGEEGEAVSFLTEQFTKRDTAVSCRQATLATVGRVSASVLKGCQNSTLQAALHTFMGKVHTGFPCYPKVKHSYETF